MQKRERRKRMSKITLKAARVNAGLTQKQAAEALGISNSTLVKWENGKAAPRVEKIDALCALYSTNYDNLNFLPNNPL
jgi:transcriptional regulator with XRE-family HTH domain